VVRRPHSDSEPGELGPLDPLVAPLTCKHTSKTCGEDADTLIVQTATELLTNNTVVVVGSDVDLLILMKYLSKQYRQLYLYNLIFGECFDKAFSVSCIQQHFQETYIVEHCSSCMP